MIRFTLFHVLIVIALSAVAANALRVVGAKAAPSMVYALAAAVAACWLLRRQRPTVRALTVVGAAAVGAQLGAMDLPTLAGGPLLVFHAMLLGALVAVLGVRPWSAHETSAGKGCRRRRRLALLVGAVSATIGAALILGLAWYDLHIQRAPLSDVRENAGKVLIIVLFVTGLVVATTLAVRANKTD